MKYLSGCELTTLELLEHSSDAACLVVISHDETGSSTLDCLQCVYVGFGGVVPHCGSWHTPTVDVLESCSRSP